MSKFRLPPAPSLLLILAFCLPLPPARAADTTQPAPAPETVYEDPSAQSSATVTQVLPNSTTTQLNFTNVRLIQIKQDTLVINWGTTATSLLPRQFVLALTVNKRAPAPTDNH